MDEADENILRTRIKLRFVLNLNEAKWVSSLDGLLTAAKRTISG